MALNLFPVHVPIGSAAADGSVLMTPEFSRALADVFSRIGGANGLGSDDLALLAAFGDTQVAAADAHQDEDPAVNLAARVAELEKMVQELRDELGRANTAPAQAAEIIKLASALEVALVMAPDPRTLLAGLGTMAKQNANAVAITGGTVAGLTSLAMASGTTLANTGALSGLLSLSTTSGITLASTGKLTLNKALAGDVIANLVNLDAGGYGLRVAGGASGGGYVASFNTYAGVNVATLDGTGNLALSSLTVSGAAPNPGATKVAFGSATATTVGAAGGAAALPATPAGYLIFNNGGTPYKLPFYNA